MRAEIHEICGLGLRTVYFTIHVLEKQWKGKKERPSWRSVERRLNRALGECNKYLKTDRIKALIREVKDFSGYPRGWRYNRASLGAHMPWYGWITGVGAVFALGEMGVNAIVRRPMAIEQHLIAKEPAPIAGQLAYTKGTATQVGFEPLRKNVERAVGFGTIKSPDYNLIWANILAHEVFHVGVLGRDWSVPAGHIASRTGRISKAVNVTKKWCCELFDELEVK